MMKIKVVSDLHIEFSDVDIPNNNECDVLILSGDIMVADDLYRHPIGGDLIYKAYRYRDFLDRCSKNYKHVVYVAGNHEFYHGKWLQPIEILRNECSRYSNVYFLEKDVKMIDDIAFIGCTLWADLNKADPVTMHNVTYAMNDYQAIKNEEAGHTKLRAIHTLERHREHVKFIQENVKNYTKCVVVGHHAPTYKSIDPNFKNDWHVNGAYASDLSHIMLDNPQIVLWTHGHTHHAVQYTVGNALVVCNPRGYEGFEPDSGWDKDLGIVI
jgi:predicted phosphodiesterase